MSRQKVFRDGYVYVLQDKCDTCIFRGGNLMDLMPGRVKGMIQECIEENSVIPCHKTIRYSGTPAAGKDTICAGFWETYRDLIWPLRLAMAMHKIKIITLEELYAENEQRD